MVTRTRTYIIGGDHAADEFNARAQAERVRLLGLLRHMRCPRCGETVALEPLRLHHRLRLANPDGSLHLADCEARS